ncbi:Ig-like domain-containing protein [Marinobacter similis]|uniref:Cadherin domain-containing protein n=1 Tax=Marinobacter similis TaxID=1420916 RepID=W5YLL7_9GAMM|nr:Ig-like domain-containing protein [Marinobacter similis]AHI29966.1 hypothetical protein AU14_02840 [Marinobacter similis]
MINITVTAVTDLTAQDDSFTLDEDAVLTDTVAANDSTTSGGALSYALATDVSNGSLTLNTNGSFSYTPTAHYHGPDSFTYTVTDSGSGESSTQTVSITVNSVDDPVTINGNTTGAGNEDTTISGTLTASDNADGLTDGTYFTVSTDGTNGTASIDPATGLWSYTPTADFSGSDSFTVTVTDDDGYTDTQVISVIVTPVVDIVNDTLITDEDTPITANVLTGTNGASADNFEGTPTLTAVTNGSNGTVSYQSDGTFTYTPDANFNGNDSFTYTITSGGVTETGTVNITVNAVNDLPTGAVTISGIAMLGETLTAANSLADADGMGPVTYTWKADGIEVGKGTTYTLTESEVGRVITVEASYKDQDGGNELMTSGTGVVAREPLTPLSPQPVSEYELEPEAESEPEPEADLEIASEAEPNFAREPEIEQTEEAVTTGAEQLAPINDEILAQVLATEPAARDSYQYEAKSYNPVPPKFIDLLSLDLAPFEPDSNEIGDLAWLMDNASFSDGLDDMKRDLDEAAAATANQEKMRAEVLLGATAGLSVGVISWVLRAGSLIAGFMSIAPLWRQIDPIPVLGEEDQEKDAQHAESEAENEVEQIFSREDSSRQGG